MHWFIQFWFVATPKITPQDNRQFPQESLQTSPTQADGQKKQTRWPVFFSDIYVTLQKKLCL